MSQRKNTPGCPCCNEGSCVIGMDNFNRADENPVTGLWTEKSGDWSVNANTLVAVTNGILVTSIRQGRPRNTTYNYRVQVDIVDTASSWGLICKYTDTNNYDWIELTNVAGTVMPRFWRRTGGSDTLVMDITTHPAGAPLTTTFSGSLTVILCYSEVEWSIYATTTLGTQLWTTCNVQAATALPADATTGFVGFNKGDYDNWFYYYHYLSNSTCYGCSCSCVNPSNSNDYKCIPEILLLTLTPIAAQLDCTSAPTTISMKMVQSTPLANVPPPATYIKNATKKYWYGDPVFLHEPLYYNDYFWFRLECLTNGNFELSALDYPGGSAGIVSANRANFATLDGPSGGSLSVSVTCMPIILIFHHFVKLITQFTTNGPFLCNPFDALEYTAVITEYVAPSSLLANFGWKTSNLIEGFIT